MSPPIVHMEGIYQWGCGLRGHVQAGVWSQRACTSRGLVSEGMYKLECGLRGHVQAGVWSQRACTRGSHLRGHIPEGCGLHVIGFSSYPSFFKCHSRIIAGLWSL